MKRPSLEEYHAITRLKQGDLGGMEILVDHYQVKAVYTAYHIVRDMKGAEDIVQSAFLRAAQKIAQFDENKPFEAWFIRIVVNEAIKTARRQKRFVSLDVYQDKETTALIDWLCDPEQGPAQIMETEETRQMVWQALAQLSAEQRAAIVMRYFLDMKESEIARELDRPLTTIRWWSRTARKRLRDILRSFRHTNYPEKDKR